MTTIKYQNRRVQVEVIGAINREHAWAPGRESEDTLLRDAAGRYYLRRDTKNEQTGAFMLHAQGKPIGHAFTKEPTKNRRRRAPRPTPSARRVVWCTSSACAPPFCGRHGR